MKNELTRAMLDMVAFGAFAIKWGMNWKSEGWFGHTFTVVTTIFAILSFIAAVATVATE